jgi:dihydrofolate synthase/folylpolyglutamate synthase
MTTSYEPEYQAALEYLFKFVDYSLQRNWQFSPEQFDLARMHALAHALGDPHLDYPLIHVAGTKGKGSTCAFTASILQAAGYRTGLYTSPHLDDFAERIQVDGQPISHADLVMLIDEMRPVIESIPRLTTFEIATGLAFLYFSRQGVSAAVIEVGLGGRLDATNIVHPLVTAITSISYDHTAVLGKTLSAIAGEKGGIIKSGVPLILAPQREEARQRLLQIAMERNAPLVEVGKDLQFSIGTRSLASQRLRVWRQDSQPSLELEIPLLGSHQVENAAIAVAVCQAARQAGLTIPDSAIVSGLAATRWPGRFEILQHSPLLVLDCAHNRDSAEKLHQALTDYFPGAQVCMIFGASEDKDIEGMLAELSPILNKVIVVKSFHPRAADPQAILDHLSPLHIPVEVIPDVADALAHALAEATLDPAQPLVLVTGSIFVVAGARIAFYSL